MKKVFICLFSMCIVFLNTINAQNEKLFKAIEKDKYSKVEKVLDKGDVDINGTWKTAGWTPVMLAIKNDSYDIFKLLLKYHPDIDKPNSKGVTPLMIAIAKNMDKYVQDLIDLKPNVLALSSDDENAITYSLKQKNFSLTLKLLGLASKDSNIRSRNLLMLSAAQYGNAKILEMSLSLHPTLTYTNESQNTVIHKLVRNELMDRQMLNQLTNAGANINALNNDGYTPLDIALEHLYKKRISILLNAGAKTSFYIFPAVLTDWLNCENNATDSYILLTENVKNDKIMEFYVKRDETTYYYKLIGHNGNTVFYKEVEKGIYKGSSEKKAITKNGKEYYYEMYQYNQGTCVKNAMRSSPIK